MSGAYKEQKICEICGALQSTIETEKRSITHLEGKYYLEKNKNSESNFSLTPKIGLFKS